MQGYDTILAGSILFFLEVYFIYISLGFRKNKCAICKGFLVSTKQYKNIYVGGKTGRFYKRYLDFEYEYRVNGKEYHISGSGLGTKGNLRSAVDITYQKNNPKHAYINKLTLPIQPIVAIVLFPLWVIVVIYGISMII